MSSVSKNNGDGTITIKNWYWFIRSWLVPIIMFVFGVGGAWASLNIRVRNLECNMELVRVKIEQITRLTTDIDVIIERIDGIKGNLSRIEGRLDRIENRLNK